MTLLELRRIHCSGPPRELGRAQGEQLRKPIRAFATQRVERLREYLAERGSGDVERFFDVGRRCLDVYARWDAEGYEEHCGIAEAAGMDAAELYSVGNMTDVRDVVLLPAPAADAEGCSALLVPADCTASGQLIAAQTWDLNPTDLEYVVAVHRRPSEGPETWSVTCVGCLSLIGMNAHGVSLGTTNIKTRGSRVGVGYLAIQHRAIRATTRALAAGIIESAPRAAAHTYWLADADGAVEYECSADRCVARSLDGEALARTNHCLDEHLVSEQGEEPNSSSFRRLSRMRTLLGARGQSVDSIRALFSDRADGLDSICRYPEDDQGTATNACIVCVPAERALWACRGPADRGQWEKLPFDA